MKTWMPAVVLIALFLFTGCQKNEDTEEVPKPVTASVTQVPIPIPKKAVEAYLDQALEGNAPYPLAGVSTFELLNWKFEKQVGSMVIAKLTFGSKAGTDIVSTKKFFVKKDGVIQNLSPVDIESSVRANIDKIKSAAARYALKSSLAWGVPITISQLTEAGELKKESIQPVFNEDYNDVKIVRNGADNGRLKFDFYFVNSDGNVVSIHEETE